MKLIYVSSEYSGAVVEGQVYKLLDYFVSTGWFKDVVLLQQYSSFANREITENILLNHSFRYKLFKANIYNPFRENKTKKDISNLLKQEVNDDSYIIHTRSTIMAYHVHKALVAINKPLYVLADERGAIFDELKFRRKKSNNITFKFKCYIQHLYFLQCYKYIKKNNIQVSAVSYKLRDLLVKDRFLNSNICVHPNIASDIFQYSDESRCSVRKKIGVSKNESLVVLSSGEGGLWQSDSKVIDTFLRQNIKVLNLGKHVISKEGVINLFVSHNEMPSYLSAADIAVLWREDYILNQVACPSKFGEFAVMGLYIVHNQSVDIATKFLRENKIGLLVNTVKDVKLNNTTVFYQVDRDERIKFGKNIFSIDKIAKSYFDRYIKITLE